MSAADKHINALYERARLAVADDFTGHWKPEDLLAELINLLDGERSEDVRHRLLEMQAQDVARRNERARHPRRLKRPTGTLYHPDAIIPLGGDRVLMADATQDDLNAWRLIIDENRIRQDRAWAESNEYARTRLDAFRVGKYHRLHDVETDAFGWEPPADGEYDGPDDEDEAAS